MSDPKVQTLVTHEVFQLPPAAAGEPFNFINEALHFLARWCAAYPGPLAHGAPSYVCLIGCERINDVVAGRANCTECKLFRDDTPADLLGRLYFCSYPFTRVFAQTTTLSSLNDCEAAVAAAGLTDCPVIFYNAAEHRILWRLNSGSELRQLILRAPSDSKLTSAKFDELLVEFHRNYTESPQGYTKPWYSAAKYLTKHELEEEIRDDLYLFLQHLSPEPMAVLREFYNPAGRTDLLVCFRDEKLIYYVELKVLRAWTKNGSARSQEKPEDILNWGKKGVVQVVTYRRQKNYPGAGYACCFDARERDEELPELVAFAKEQGVEYRRYFMFNSSEALQASLMK